MRRFGAVATLAFFLILTSVSLADDDGVRSPELFNASWRFARFVRVRVTQLPEGFSSK
ncbi:MAG: hypothetical protein ABSH35_21455 [Isosphaeraceae bacterium]|jgi:hypothetical protein